MKTAFLTTAFAFAGVAFAQTDGSLPACAESCVTKFTTGSNIGSCGNLDAHCICSSSSFISQIACCLAAACDAADQAAAVTYAKQLCATQGVTVPDAVSCVSSSTTSTSASTGSSPVSHSSSSVVAASVTPSSTSATSSASTSPSPSSNAGLQNAAGAGMSFAGGLAAVLALL